MADLFIRPASHTDYDALVRLMDEGDTPHRNAHPDIFRAPEGPVRDREYIHNLLADPERAILVAADGDELIGFVHAKLERSPEIPIMVPLEFAVIDNLVVAPGRRHRGVGTALVRAAENWAENRGLREIRLNVWEFNSGARSLYETLHYQTITRRMRKRLNPPARKPDAGSGSN
jgi:ribosomal protein S18 acetylase RimI-like enzyme